MQSIDHLFNQVKGSLRLKKYFTRDSWPRGNIKQRIKHEGLDANDKTFTTDYPIKKSVKKVKAQRQSPILLQSLVFRTETKNKTSSKRTVAGSIPPWACRSVPEQET